MNYYFKNVSNGDFIEVEKYFNGMYNSLIENYPTAKSIINANYDIDELNKKDTIKTVICFVNSWVDDDTDFAGVYDEDGDEIPFDELDENHSEYFDLYDILKADYASKAMKHYFN